MKKYSIIIILLYILGTQNTFAWVDDCETNKGFPLYQCRVKNLCETYKTKEPLIITTEYKEWWDDYWFDEAKDDYRKNMNDIYSCWMLKSQKKSFETIEELIKIEKSWDLSDKALKWIQEKLKKVEEKFRELKCKDIWKKDVFNKENTLKQSTYELCKYSNYLEYQKDYYSILPNVAKEIWDNDSFWITDLVNTKSNIQQEIKDELDHSFKVFPIAFNAYSEYENNFPIHVLLELIKDDLSTFRDKLYETISPMNQIVYKISNAMSIH